ncbi:hypothetical protein [Helicobacter sp. 13S00477-4]|uniref:hypothetical protein n=1 Tax=Helicobacter sp. 13S00477-4 TaxID=1905759 RepID=UPI000BA55A3F|nr:hypothetical protein [Helicobacter sp. 13S00477-4]PAF50810.1 hypothetical protein BKH44_06560 [Helicobacter sp. 13S00477-4]
MQINNHQDGLKDIFSSLYHQNILSKGFVAKTTPVLDDSLYDDLNTVDIKDIFVLTDDYSHMVDVRDKIAGGLKDARSFLAMAKMLKDKNIINNNDMIAIDFLTKESAKLDFEVFESISKNNQLSLEMRDLISKVTQKLEVIDGINGNIMNL